MAARADHRDAPSRCARRSRCARSSRPPRERASHPSSRSAASRAGRVVREHLVREVLQHDGAAGHPGRLPHDLGRLGALDRQLGEGLVHLGGRAQLGELGVDDPGVHRLGDRDEPGLAVQRDEREPAALRGPHQRRRAGRRRSAGRARPPDPRRPTLSRSATYAARSGVVGGQGDAGGQDQLAPAQQPGDVGQLADVRPAHPPVAACRRRPPPPGRPARTWSSSRTSATVGNTGDSLRTSERSAGGPAVTRRTSRGASL